MAEQVNPELSLERPQLVQRRKDSLLRAGGRQHLRRLHLAILQEHQIGKGAPHIDPQAGQAAACFRLIQIGRIEVATQR